MRQVYLDGPSSIKSIDIEKPTVKPGWILAKTLFTGICGSDIKSYYGQTTVGNSYPFHIGHEVCAQVVEINSEKNIIKENDVIVIDPIFSCGTCENCFSGRTNKCKYGTVIGIEGYGGFSECILVPETSTFKVLGNNPSIMTLVEPLSTVIYGFSKLRIYQADKLLIQGCGSIGLLFLSYAISLGYQNITVTDINNERLAIAQKIGAKHIVNPNEEINDMHKLAFDVIIDTTGVVNVFQNSINMLNFGGQFLLFGLCAPEAQISMFPFEMFQKDISLQFSHKSTKKDFLIAIYLLENNLIKTEFLIEDIRTLNKLEESIIEIHAGYTKGKIIIDLRN